MASLYVPCPKCCSIARCSTLVPEPANPQRKHSVISFRHGLNLNASLTFGSLLNNPRSSRVQLPKKPSSIWKVRAQLNDVAAKKSSSSTPVLEPTSSNGKVMPTENPDGKKTVADISSISAFMSQVSDIVKLVDSRDIVEFQMKQSDCEILIRKKEAMPQPPLPSPVYQMPPQMHYSPPPAQAVAPANPAPSAPALALPAPAKKSSSSHPPLKCPMAGTFYRCPGPGEPPFIKVGDKVQKGQVICIIEAMKLMNEIEADQSGTVTEVIAEDGKPVSVDTPLFVIVP